VQGSVHGVSAGEKRGGRSGKLWAQLAKPAALGLISPLLQSGSFIERPNLEQHEQTHSRRHRGLDLRTLAQQFLSRRAASQPGTELRQPAAHGDRSQRHLLQQLQAADLQEVA
jgi:hypothetical protein